MEDYEKLDETERKNLLNTASKVHDAKVGHAYRWLFKIMRERAENGDVSVTIFFPLKETYRKLSTTYAVYPRLWQGKEFWKKLKSRLREEDISCKKKRAYNRRYDNSYGRTYSYLLEIGYCVELSWKEKKNCTIL